MVCGFACLHEALRGITHRPHALFCAQHTGHACHALIDDHVSPHRTGLSRPVPLRRGVESIHSVHRAKLGTHQRMLLRGGGCVHLEDASPGRGVWVCIQCSIGRAAPCTLYPAPCTQCSIGRAAGRMALTRLDSLRFDSTGLDWTRIDLRSGAQQRRPWHVRRQRVDLLDEIHHRKPARLEEVDPPHLYARTHARTHACRCPYHADTRIMQVSPLCMYPYHACTLQSKYRACTRIMPVRSKASIVHVPVSCM